MGLKFEKLGITNGETYGKLHINIRCAENLLNMDVDDYTDGFVVMFLLPNKSSKSKRKTQVVKNDLSPTWNEWFLYNEVSLEQLSSSHALEVAVWDHDLLSNDFVGGVRIGPAPKPRVTKEWMDSNSVESSHWEEMLSRPGEWVERCHTLRASMEYRILNVPPSLPQIEDDDGMGSGSVLPIEKISEQTSAESISELSEVSKQASAEEEKIVPRVAVSESTLPAGVDKSGGFRPSEDAPATEETTSLPSFSGTVHSAEGEKNQSERTGTSLPKLSIPEPTVTTSDESTLPDHKHRVRKHVNLFYV